MTDFSISCTVRFANGAPAPNIDVAVEEPGRATYRPGSTGADGTINAFLRKKDGFEIAGFRIESPWDRPRFNLIFSTSAGRTFRAANAGEVTLPDFFGPDERPSDTAAQADSPAGLAKAALQPLIGVQVPGYVYMVRRNGQPWALLEQGLRIVASPSQRARAMSHNTILHIASMAKPITVAAFAAMIDDWAALKSSVGEIAAGTAARTALAMLRVSPSGSSPVTISAPTVLVPLYFNPAVTARLGAEGLLAGLPASVRQDLDAVAGGRMLPNARPPSALPGYFGLIRRVLRGDRVATMGTPFLQLIAERLGPGLWIGTRMDEITIRHLVQHTTNFVGYDMSRVSQEEVAAVAPTEPADGSAAGSDYWGQTRLLLRRDADPSAPYFYRGDNYVILTTVIDACTEEPYDSYVNRRLFFDSRFDRIRRRVAYPGEGARYYKGAGWTGGELLPDYRAWPGNGGHYASARQLTDWLHILFSRTPVASASGGTAPLVSATARNLLFSRSNLFTGGFPDQPSPTTYGYSHNGGAGPNGGAANGKMGLYVSNSGAVYTVALLMNGELSADAPYSAALISLANSAHWT